MYRLMMLLVSIVFISNVSVFAQTAAPTEKSSTVSIQTGTTDKTEKQKLSNQKTTKKTKQGQTGRPKLPTVVK